MGRGGENRMSMEIKQELQSRVGVVEDSFVGIKREIRSKNRILVVDDDPLIVKILKEPLERAGYDVNVARQGLEALQKVKERRPDLIILDILMPLMDGFKVARFLKFDKRFKDIPIIVLTSRATEGERKMGEKVGANEYLYKPFRLPHVMDVIQRYMNG
jgi:chemosensory pili system protein ChpA (sensor histidine kinase/response regulator)